MSDVSGIIRSSGVALEQEAYKQFGAAVEKQAGGLLNGIFNASKKGVPGATDASQVVKNIENGVWDPTPYASALTSFAGNLDPKFKFLFRVSFEFHPEARDLAASMGVELDELSRNLTFVVRNIDLPKLDFDYEEVNMYNFRTKVLRSIKHSDLSLSFYDVTANHPLNFARIYMMIYMPISRMLQSSTIDHENYGFAFSKDVNSLDTSYRSAMENRKDILSKMTIEQFYMNLSGESINGIQNSVKLNRFQFVNPRITKFDFGDQAHENGQEPTVITASFDYDALYVLTGQDGRSANTPSLAGADILDGVQETPATVIRGSATTPGKSNNPFIDIMARQGQRIVQTAVGNALYRSLGTVAGGALSGAIGKVSGAFSEAAGRTIANIGKGVTQGLALPTTPPVKDNSVSSGSVQSLSSVSKSTD